MTATANTTNKANCITGKEDFELLSKGQKSQINSMMASISAMQGMAGKNEKVEIAISKNNDGDKLSEFAFGVKWLNSLFDFWRLGIKLQEDKKKPYPHISW